MAHGPACSLGGALIAIDDRTSAHGRPRLLRRAVGCGSWSRSRGGGWGFLKLLSYLRATATSTPWHGVATLGTRTGVGGPPFSQAMSKGASAGTCSAWQAWFRPRQVATRRLWGVTDALATSVGTVGGRATISSGG